MHKNESVIIMNINELLGLFCIAVLDCIGTFLFAKFKSYSLSPKY